MLLFYKFGFGAWGWLGHFLHCRTSLASTVSGLRCIPFCLRMCRCRAGEAAKVEKVVVVTSLVCWVCGVLSGGGVWSMRGPSRRLAKDGERVAKFRNVASLGNFSILGQGVLAYFG